MAIFHCTIKNFNRRSGSGNICSAAAYRSGERLRSLDDATIKYPHRSQSDIEYSGLLNNPYSSRQELWNEVEKKDNRKNSNLAREIMVAIPKELNREQRKELVCAYSDRLVGRYNVAVDYSIHKPTDDNDNFHAHILFTTREIQNNELCNKTRVLDEKQTGSKEFEYIRKTWAERANSALKDYGFSERISAEKSENEIKCIHHGYNAELKQENEVRQKVITMESELKMELQLLEKEKQRIIKEIIAKEIDKLDELKKEHEKGSDKEEKSEGRESKEEGVSIEFYKTPLAMRFEEEKKQLMQARADTLNTKYTEMAELNKKISRLGREFNSRNIFYRIFAKKSHKRKIEKIEKALKEKRDDLVNIENIFDEKIYKQIKDHSRAINSIKPGQQLDNIRRSVLDEARERAQERLKTNSQELDRGLHL